jgi:hypothetical protein
MFANVVLTELEFMADLLSSRWGDLMVPLDFTFSRRFTPTADHLGRSEMLCEEYARYGLSCYLSEGW